MGVIRMAINPQITIRPQPGAQENFLASNADIVIYGGAAGGGKTYSLLLECLRHVDNSKFNAVVFRRQANQITNAGGLWDTAIGMYAQLGARFKSSPSPQVVFPSGANIGFHHLQLERDVYAWQGSQIALIAFDELTHFTEKQFFYMLSRNRSLCGIKPYVRATTNPDADSWVAEFISWWIDQETGYSIPERSGKVRYFYRVDGSILWGDTIQELVNKYQADPKLCKSVTFIASSIYDNQILLEANPEYLANLNGLDIVEKERLLKGNWKIRPSAGLYFKRENVRIVQHIPDNIISVCRSWDLAATEITSENRNPDRTAGVLMGRLKSGEFIVLDVIRRAANAADVRRMIVQTAKADRADYGLHTITLPQDPGQAGKDQAATYVKALAGHKVRTAPVTGSKIVRAVPFSAQWQGGNVLLLAGDWNKEYLQEMEGFPDALHDDMVDASSDAFKNVANAADWSALIS
jgi:predicted phage terminase large subunit-like protein